MLTMNDENQIRKAIWARKDAVDARMAEPGFEALPTDEQDAQVLALMLDVTPEAARRCLGAEARADERERLWTGLDELFRYGKRSALRPLKDVLARHETLKKPD